jgi:hypothetical protein
VRRQDHHERRAERDRVLRRRSDTEACAARTQVGRLGELEERQQPAQVVEDVVARASFDHREERHERAAPNHRLREEVGVPDTADDADDEVEHEQEAGEEGQLLGHVGLDARHADGVDDDRGDRRRRDERQGPLDSGATQPHAWIDEQGRRPDEDEQHDQHAVRLELEGQVAGQRVPPDRDEEDDADQHGDQRRPAEQSLMEHRQQDYGQPN